MSGAAVAEAPAAGGGGATGGGGGGGGSNKALIIVVLVFNVLIAAGLGYQVLMGQGKAAAGHIKGGHGEEDGHEKQPAAPKFGPLVEIGALVANLSGPLSGHYAKVFVHAEAADDKAKLVVEGALVPIRAETLLYLSGLELKDAAGQSQIRSIAEELTVKLNALVGKSTIKRVYFSEFVIQ
jgi:flagellar protein FliL